MVNVIQDTTDRGFKIVYFNDRYDSLCTVQESSLATENAIWLGISDPEPKIMASKIMEGGTGWVKYPIPKDVMINTRMHLTKEHAEFLVKILTRFIETGQL